MKGEARNIWYLNNFLALKYLLTFFILIHPSATQYYELLFVIYYEFLYPMMQRSSHARVISTVRREEQFYGEMMFIKLIKQQNNHLSALRKNVS